MPDMGAGNQTWALCRNSVHFNCGALSSVPSFNFDEIKFTLFLSLVYLLSVDKNHSSLKILSSFCNSGMKQHLN